jgi:hypothetical protein
MYTKVEYQYVFFDLEHITLVDNLCVNPYLPVKSLY